MHKRFTISLVAAVLLSLSAFLLPQIPTLPDRIVTAVCLAIVVTQILSAWFFLTSLRAFRKRLQVAYSIVAAGIFIFSLTQLQLPLPFFVTLDPIVAAWAVVIPVMLGAIVMLVGVRSFARILGIHNLWTSILAASSLALIIAFVTSLLPHGEMGINEKVVDGIFGTLTASSAFTLVAAVVTLRIRKGLSTTYKPALGYLSAALSVAALACIHEATIKLLPFFVDNEHYTPYYTYGFSLWPFLLTAILFLAAGALLKETSNEQSALPESATYIDVVNFVAQKVSNPVKIDTTLDQVRRITSMQKSTDAELSSSEKATLMGVYKDIEKYLVTEEPLRSFTKESLRRTLPESFQQLLSK